MSQNQQLKLALFGLHPITSSWNDSITIGQYMVANPPAYLANTDTALVQSCTGGVHDVKVSAPNAFSMCALAPDILAPRWLAMQAAGGLRTIAYMNFFASTLSATIEDENGSIFKIVLPTGLCAQNVIGNTEDPNTGIVVNDATLSSLYQSLVSLKPESQFNYTTSMLQKTTNTLDTALAQAICDSPVGGTRALLYTLRRVEAQNMNEWKCFLFTLGGLWGLGYLANAGPVANTSRLADLTGWGQTSLIAATAVIGSILTAGLGYLQKRGSKNTAEAFIINLFLAIVEGIINFVILIFGSCIPIAQVDESVQELRNVAASPNPVVLGPNVVPESAEVAVAEAQPQTQVSTGIAYYDPYAT